MAFSPIFAHLAHSFDRLILTATGLAIWVAASLMAGMSKSYTMFLIARLISGVGEASFISLAPPFIEDYVPAESKTKWLSFFYLAIPVGGALGYVVSGPLTQKDPQHGWRWPFQIEGYLMIPLVIYCFLVPRFLRGKKTVIPVPATAAGESTGLAGSANFGSSAGSSTVVVRHNPFIDTSFFASMLRLGRNPTYVCSALGYAAFNFVVGGVAYWGVKYLVDGEHHVSQSTASIAFGGAAAGGGLVGTVFGGWIVDHYGGSAGLRGAERAMKFCTLFVLGSLPFLLLAFLVPSVSLVYPLVTVGQVLLWSCSSPINAATMSAVHPEDRSIAMAISTFTMHALGDLPSNTLIGFVQTKSKNWRLTMLITTAWLGWAVLFWMLSWFAARSRRIQTSRDMLFTDSHPDDSLMSK